MQFDISLFFMYCAAAMLVVIVIVKADDWFAN